MADPTPVADAAASHGGGLPQFDLSQWPGQIVWLLITFLFLYLMFSRVFVPNIGETISEREDRIAGDIAKARRLKEEAEAQAKAAAAEMHAARDRAQSSPRTPRPRPSRTPPNSAPKKQAGSPRASPMPRRVSPRRATARCSTSIRSQWKPREP